MAENKLEYWGNAQKPRRCKNDWGEALKSMLQDKNVSSLETNHMYKRSLSFLIPQIVSAFEGS